MPRGSFLHLKHRLLSARRFAPHLVGALLCFGSGRSLCLSGWCNDTHTHGEGERCRDEQTQTGTRRGDLYGTHDSAASIDACAFRGWLYL